MINKIAAGEVVERPLSVIKELTENSIDAGAKIITIEVKDGGMTYIRVTDNGIGIPKDDVKNAFLRHATSKILNLDDLENVLSLGFRGEALSSISSVSQVEMITKTKDDSTGVRIEMTGEDILSFEDIGCAEGTSIVVRNIFFNVPARRKFLKKATTESGYISDMVNKLSLGHTDITFKYINNSSIILQTNGNGDLKSTIFQVYGKEVAKKLIPVEFAEEDFLLSGFIGKPEIARGNRKYENIFINGRYIKSELIESAVEEAYKTKLFQGKFPLFVLNLKINPTEIDVNVHPTKLEVRFSNEEIIYSSVFKAVSQALKQENLIPDTNWGSDKKNENLATKLNIKPLEASEKQKSLTDFIYKPLESDDATTLKESTKPLFMLDEEVIEKPKSYEFKINNSYFTKENKIANSIKENSINKNKEDVKLSENILKSEESKKEPFFKNYKVIGQAFSTYWIIEQESSIYLIDQHAAHERVLFENLSNKLKNEKINSQRLIQPLILKLTEKELELINENKELLDNFGFELEEFGEKTFALRATPYILKNPESTDFFMEILDKLENISTQIENIYETKINEIATSACKAAVKGNDKLSYEEAKKLIEDLLLLENPFTCPHGRPTIVAMSKYELEKKFKRV